MRTERQPETVVRWVTGALSMAMAGRESPRYQSHNFGLELCPERLEPRCIHITCVVITDHSALKCIYSGPCILRPCHLTRKMWS